MLRTTETSSWILNTSDATATAIDLVIYSKTVGLIRVVKAYACCFKLLVTEGWEVAYKGVSFIYYSGIFLDLISARPAFVGLREGLAVISGMQTVLHRVDTTN